MSIFIAGKLLKSEQTQFKMYFCLFHFHKTDFSTHGCSLKMEWKILCPHNKNFAWQTLLQALHNNAEHLNINFEDGAAGE